MDISSFGFLVPNFQQHKMAARRKQAQNEIAIKKETEKRE
jgi:hypothetical protein